MTLRTLVIIVFLLILLAVFSTGSRRTASSDVLADLKLEQVDGMSRMKGKHYTKSLLRRYCLDASILRKQL